MIQLFLSTLTNFLHQVVIGLLLLLMEFMQVTALLRAVLVLKVQIGFFMINQKHFLQVYLGIQFKLKMGLKFFLVQLVDQKTFLIHSENQMIMS